MAQHYFPQLDGIRALAITLVIIFHWFPEGRGVNLLANGPFGVTLFFVLSGFLITRILLQYRELLPDHGLGTIYRVFMQRRILRIFPLYYFVLLALWVGRAAGVLPEIHTSFFAHPEHYLLYLSNFSLEKTHDWADLLSVFWSLAVEEQFYLLWPFVILLMPQHRLRLTLILTIILGITSRVGLYLSGHTEGTLMPTCLDAFGMGGLWAYTVVFKDQVDRVRRWFLRLAIIGFAVFVWLCLYPPASLVTVALFRTSMAMAACFLVIRASEVGGFGGVVGIVLENSIVRYIGKISYGLYVYHMIVPTILVPLLIGLINRVLHVSLIRSDLELRLFSLLVLICLATLSWFLLELPLIRTKVNVRLQSKSSV